MSDELTEKLNQVLNDKTIQNGFNANNASENIKSDSKKVAAAWIFNDSDFEKVQEIVEDPEEEIIEEKKEDKKTERKSDFNSQNSSAETATGMLDLAINAIFLPVELWRYKKSFKDNDWKEVKTIIHEDRALLAPDKQLLYDRVTRAQVHFKGRKDEIRMAQDELETKKRAFLAYYKANPGKELSPEMLFWGNIIMAFGDRVTNTLMDDGY